MLVLRYNDVIFCLHELCRSHTKKHVLLKFFRKKKDGELNEFVQNIIGRNGLSVPSMIFHKKLTKQVHLNEKPAVDAHSLSKHNKILHVFLSSYAAKRTILVPASPHKIKEVIGILHSSVRLKFSDARRCSCCLMRIIRRESNATKRYCDDDVCLMLTMSGFLTGRYSQSNNQSTPKMIACMLQQVRNRPLQVVVWSRAASTSVKA